jgi:transposase
MSISSEFSNQNSEIYKLADEIMNEKLSFMAKTDLREFLEGTHNQVNLDRSFRNNDSIAKEVYTAYEPLRKIISKKLGSKILLHRIQPKGSFKFKRTILSFADKEYFPKFLRGHDLKTHDIFNIQVSVSDIVAFPVIGNYREFVVRAKVLP